MPSVLKLQQTEDKDLRFLAGYIYHHVFYSYTLKQWGLKPEELDPSVTGRVPVYISRDDRYFQDTYQAMPKQGYTAMFQRMLRHKNIKVLLNTDYREVVEEVKFDRMIYTGPIDAFFDHMYGPLPYRSLRFVFEYQEVAQAQEVGTVNYPNEHAFTRITEFKHLTGQKHPGSTVAVEYPQAHEPRLTIPYYPLPREENSSLYNLYRKEAERLKQIVFFAGRLADYRCYNMDQAVAQALKLFEEACLWQV